MDNKKQVFLLYGCDIWKSSYGMSLLCVSTSPSKIRAIIIKNINSGHLCYEDEELSISEQIESFKEDWKNSIRKRINDKLIYAYYDYVYDGEEI